MILGSPFACLFFLEEARAAHSEGVFVKARVVCGFGRDERMEVRRLGERDERMGVRSRKRDVGLCVEAISELSCGIGWWVSWLLKLVINFAMRLSTFKSRAFNTVIYTGLECKNSTTFVQSAVVY